MTEVTVGMPLVAIPMWAQCAIALVVQLFIVMGICNWAGIRIAKWLNARKHGGSQCKV